MAVLRGFHQAPRNLPTVQTTAMLIVHCAAAFFFFFTVHLKNSPLSDSLLYIKSELSLVVPSKTGATNTHGEYISLRIQPPDA